MKNLLFLSMCLFGLLTFSGCGKNDSVIDSGSSSKSSKVKWYGVKTIDTQSTTKGVSDKGNLWNQSVGIYVKFLNDPKGDVTLDKIKGIAAEWEEYAGIKFYFVEGETKANVRIAFDWNDNDWLTWSYTGTNAKFVKDQTQPTAVLGGLQYQNETEFKGDILRVFGQILGLEYEQRHQDWSSWKSEAQLQRYWEGMFDEMNMDWNEIREYVFTPLSGENAIFPTQTTEIDELSVMAWPYYSRTQTTNPIANFELSEGDKAFIATLYPKTLPSIQEAWVDTGFFQWTDNTKKALRITELGAEQEYLPDVSDGQQLNSANRMFCYSYNDKTKLARAPKFNTSNISNFYEMFKNCSYLETIPTYDTSKGIVFSQMFADCSSLKSIPLLDTSNGTDFSDMFNMGESLVTIPSLNTSKGTNFSGMFNACLSLKTIPLLNTSNGTDFSNMFNMDESLATIPSLNTSKGTDFTCMFCYCLKLTEVPLLDTSNGIYFYKMFASCASLKNIPALNTSNGGDFRYMFLECTSLTAIPKLNTSRGSLFRYMFAGCKSLKTIPLLDISKGDLFIGMFSSCTSLETIPQLDTKNATNFESMFYNCTSLKTIPLLDTSKGWIFTNMFRDCTSLETTPSLKTLQGYYFGSMFENCTSLKEKPNLDLPKEKEADNMYKGTPFENEPI